MSADSIFQLHNPQGFQTMRKWQEEIADEQGVVMAGQLCTRVENPSIYPFAAFLDSQDDRGSHIQARTIYDIEIANAPVAQIIRITLKSQPDVCAQLDATKITKARANTCPWNQLERYVRVACIINTTGTAIDKNDLVVDFSEAGLRASSKDVESVKWRLHERAGVRWDIVDLNHKDEDVVIFPVIEEDSVMNYIQPEFRSIGWSAPRLAFSTEQGERFGENAFEDRADYKHVSFDDLAEAHAARPHANGRGVQTRAANTSQGKKRRRATPELDLDYDDDM